jgi:hypothetical protein
MGNANQRHSIQPPSPFSPDGLENPSHVGAPRIKVPLNHSA